MKIQDEKALMDAVMEKASEFAAESAPEFDDASWSFKKFERMGMPEYDSNMPLQQGTFRRFLDFLSGVMKQAHGCTNYHDLGVSDEPVENMINCMEPILKKYFDTEIFVVRRTDGTVAEYGMLHGEGEYGAGKQQVVETDLVNLGGGLALSLDNAMNDDSENGVKNRVIKEYVDRLTRRLGDDVLLLEQNKVAKAHGQDLMPLAQEPDNTSGHFLNALGEYRKVSANDFTDELKEKLDSVEPAANVNVQADYAEMDITSDSFIKNKPDLSIFQTREGDSGDNTVDFTEISKNENISSGDSHTTLFGKIKGWFSALKTLAFKDKVDWQTDVENKPVLMNKIKAGRELVNPDSDNVVHFQANEVIAPLKCDPVLKIKGVGNVVIYGHYNEGTGTTEIRVKCAEHLSRQIELGSLLKVYYTFVNGLDLEESGTAEVFFTVSSMMSIIRDGYWTCKNVNNSNSLVIQGYEDVVALNASDYNVPINILLNTDVLPEDIAPVYYPDQLEFLHSEEPGYKHLPAGGKIGQVLTNTADGNGTWQDNVIVIPVDFTKSAEERKAEVLTFVEPYYADGTIYKKPVYAQFTFKKIPRKEFYSFLIKGRNDVKISMAEDNFIFDSNIVNNKQILSVRLERYWDDPVVAYYESEVLDKTPRIITEHVMQTYGTPEGKFCFFAMGNCVMLNEALYALNHNIPFVFFYKLKNADRKIVPGYLICRTGIEDVTKVIYETGCQWEQVNATGVIIHHDYRVITNEIPVTDNLVSAGAAGMAYKTETVISERTLSLPTGVEGKFLKAMGEESYEWADCPLPDLSGKVDKVEGKGLSTEDVNIVVTDTLASSYPDGTIVIKTE